MTTGEMSTCGIEETIASCQCRDRPINNHIIITPRPNQKQGHSAGTILTNTSNILTVITPYDKQRNNPASSSSRPSLKKGTRLMHRTTLSMDERLWKRDFSTSAKVAFGSKSTDNAEIPAACPTLHTSHFDIGLNKQQYFNTTYKNKFVEWPTEHPNRLHYPTIVNWSHNVTGDDMQKVLTRNNNQQDYWTSNSKVYYKPVLGRGMAGSRPEQQGNKFDLIAGKCTSSKGSRDKHLVSGNRILYSARRDAPDYFMLG